MPLSESQKAAKQKYYSSEKGKAQKRKEDAAYVASGKRAITEAKREAKPISEARKQARKNWAERNKHYFAADRAKRRSLERSLSDFDSWVLLEAMLLSRIREQMCGGVWHVDHIVPISKGGLSTHDNLQVVPASWNRKKSNKHTERFFACA